MQSHCPSSSLWITLFSGTFQTMGRVWLNDQLEGTDGSGCESDGKFIGHCRTIHIKYLTNDSSLRILQHCLGTLWSSVTDLHWDTGIEVWVFYHCCFVRLLC